MSDIGRKIRQHSKRERYKLKSEVLRKSLTVGSGLESDEVTAGACDGSVERLNAQLVAGELVQVGQDVHACGRRMDRHLGVVSLRQ